MLAPEVLCLSDPFPKIISVEFCSIQHSVSKVPTPDLHVCDMFNQLSSAAFNIIG